MVVTPGIENVVRGIIIQAHQTRKTLLDQGTPVLASFDALVTKVADLLQQLQASLNDERSALNKTAEQVHEHAEVAERQASILDQMIRELQLT